MRFSIYSEIQHWPGKSEAQVYGEVLEQIVNADRLGYDAYAVIEHFAFPKFSISATPMALFGAASARTQRIHFRTLLHALPYVNPMTLAAQIVELDILTGGRYEWGVGRGHGWIPQKVGFPLDGEARPKYEEALEVLCLALTGEPVNYEGRHFHVVDGEVYPRPSPHRRFRVFLGGTSDRTYELAAERGWAVVVPPLLPYAALEAQLTLYRQKCAEHGHEPDIVWIHACYVDDDRDLARREAETMMTRFLAGNASPLVEHPAPPADRLAAADYGFYSSGILEQLAQMPYERMIDDDVVWVGTPDEVSERIQAVIDVCEGLTEISITVNPGGVEHWKSIKAQELFARDVIPRFQPAAERAAARS
jgi:alkanesulfonate monooxygenase SsuD/methylene tetrahydromethanopterin reductase-like flavin-dependent oxidoreductase (luciferase family)